VFEGRSQKLVLENIRRVSFGKQGRDFVNNWISIDYGNGALVSAALFADGNMRGWAANATTYAMIGFLVLVSIAVRDQWRRDASDGDC